MVTNSKLRDPVTYQIKNLLHEPIQDIFYTQELQEMQLKEKNTILKILKKLTRKDHVEYRV